eukprot:sb/3462897/
MTMRKKGGARLLAANDLSAPTILRLKIKFLKTRSCNVCFAQPSLLFLPIDSVSTMSLIAKYHNNEVVMDMTLKLFVGQVPKNFEESDLKPYFEKYGPLVNIKVCRDRDTKTHKGCAFVTFANLDNAENAMHEMHDRIALPGAKKEMQIKAVHNDDSKKFDKRLFVGMISKSLNGDELKAMFSKFGEVVDCNILTSMINGEKTSRGCGFVKFAKASSCLQAIKEMHQSQTMDGCNSPIVVKHADSPADKMKRNAAGFDEREDSKRNHFRNSAGGGMQQQFGNPGIPPPPLVKPPPMGYRPPPPQQPNRNQYGGGGGNNATATALISAFTPLLATVAEQNTPGTTRMLVESIKIALNALHHENTTSAQAAMVSIASSLSVAVANNLNKKKLINGEKTSRGCGFVKFAKASSCLQAIKEMHQSQTMDGCNSPIVVKHADSPADKMKRNAAGFDEREDSKRNHFRNSAGGGMQQQFGNGPYGGGGNQFGGGYPIAPPPPQQPNRNQYGGGGGGNNATATALISAFTPLLATVAEQNTPGTTRMLVESIKIALNALHHENTTSAQAAMVSIASSLSVAVANNLNKKTNNFDHQNAPQQGGMFGNSSEFYNPAAPVNNNNMNSSGFGSGMNNYYNTTPPGVQQYNRPN